MRSVPNADFDVLQQRLNERTQLICKADAQQKGWLRQFFTCAERLGQFLHAAREFTETVDCELLSDPRVIWLWEQGLILPEEVATGQVSRLIDHYLCRNTRLSTPNIDPRPSDDLLHCVTSEIELMHKMLS